MTEIVHSADQVIIDFPITFPTTGPITSAIGAVCVATAWPLTGGASIAALSNVLNGNTCRSTWAVAALEKGGWRVQLKMTISGQPQIVADEVINVIESNL